MNEKLKDLFLNWKGLELIHSLKSISKIFLISLSIIFIIISIKISNIYILIASLIVLFLQVFSEDNKEYYLKYKEIFEKVKNGKNYRNYKNWIDFLEKTRGLNSFYREIVKVIFNKQLNSLKSNKIKS